MRKRLEQCSFEPMPTVISTNLKIEHGQTRFERIHTIKKPTMNLQRLNTQLILTSGDNLTIYDTKSGENSTVKVPPPNLPPNLTKGQLEVLNKEERTINSVAISRDSHHIAISTENKQVVIYTQNLEIKRNFILNRTASKVMFAPSGDILVADRTGDVYLYKLNENSEPVFLLGHLSIILDMVLSDCGKYIVTCDRDEKIRVSHFPNTYNIVSYCLGHEEFVTSVKFVKDVLVSASGDGTVRIWNYLKGVQLSAINTNKYIGNLGLLETFSKEMEKEKVDVTALPISDMQTYFDNNNLFIGISLYTYKGIQLYKVHLETCDFNYLKSIEVSEAPYNFNLTNNLYVINNFTCSFYKLTNDDYIEAQCAEFENFHEKYKNTFKLVDSNCITVLYKRKFDNVQEYLERKKLRLESNQ